jgi:hypothetical protein
MAVHDIISALLYVTLGVCSVGLIVWVTLTHRLARDILASPKLPDSRCIYCAVDAIVAVRNESANVFGCVNTLLSQKGVRKVIIVDDHSDDGTAELARSLAEPLRPVTVLSLEGGELGKADACWAGARLSDAEWLLFVDADTRLQEGVVEKALSLALQRGVDAVSILGSFRCSSILGEAFTALNVGLLNAFATLKDVNDTAKRTAYFAGSFILTRRSQYLALGGHSAVRCEIVEDKALAELYKKRGYRILLCYAPQAVSTVWGGGKGDGLVASMIREITPSMTSAGSLRSAAFSVGMSVLHLAPYLGLILGFTAPKPLGTLFFAFGVTTLLMVMLFEALSLRITGGSMKALPAYFAALPLQIASFWIGVYKAWRGKPVKWRGRLYQPQKARSTAVYASISEN